MPKFALSDEIKSRSFSLPLSVPRRVVCDLVHFAKQVPTVPVQRTIDVSQVARLRTEQATRIGWCAIFTKALALVAKEMPELRRAYVEYPLARLYQHSHSIASVAIERSFEGEPGVFFAYLPRPETTPLTKLEAAINYHKKAPVSTAFRFVLRFYSLPRPVRRFLWWYLLNVRGSRKAEFLGTFGVSAYSRLGAESLHPLSPLTTTLNYGVIGEDGRVTVRIVYDHRTLDGSTIARALARLEEVLNADIALELLALAEAVPNATAPALLVG